MFKKFFVSKIYQTSLKHNKMVQINFVWKMHNIR